MHTFTAARHRSWPRRVIVTVLVLSGAVLSLWPVGETIVHSHESAQLVARYTDEVAAAEPPAVAAELRSARDYNQQLPAELLRDPWGASQVEGAGDHRRYLGELSSAEAMARIRVPQIAVDLPVYHDADSRSMATGAGHMYGSSLPVGGAGTHAVLAAHTGMRARTFFDRLPELRVDQQFQIDVAGQSLHYRVDQIVVVEPWELEAVERIPGGDYVTLVTCYTPPGEHQQRMLVRGVRMPETQASPETHSTVAERDVIAYDLHVQTWMWPRLAGAGAGLLFLLSVAARWLICAARHRAPSLRSTTAAPQPRRNPA